MSFPPRLASYPAFPARVTNEEYSPATPELTPDPFSSHFLPGPFTSDEVIHSRSRLRSFRGRLILHA